MKFRVEWHGMSRSLPLLSALLMVATVAVISAGCGGAHRSSGPETAAPPTSRAIARGKAVRFAVCMRAHGVQAFPYPDPSGKLTIDGIANGSSVDTSSAAFVHALSACKRLEPPGFTGTKATPRQRRARLAFARCVRENGVPDFPDATRDGPLVDTNRIPSSGTPEGMSALNAAMQKCGRYAAAAGVQASSEAL